MTITHEHNGFSGFEKTPNFLGVINTMFASGKLIVFTVPQHCNIRIFKPKNYHVINKTIIHVGQWRVKQKETKN